ncbi:MAG: formate/nitrite transporter family protein [Clostridium sp.]
MTKTDVDIIGNLASYKGDLAKNRPMIYTLRAVMAGFYLVVAIVLSYTTGALVNKISPELAKIASAMTFSIALALICFLGGELFTGSNLVMGVGLYSGKTDTKDLIRVFCLSYLGNLIGNMTISYIFVKSGASFDLLREYIQPIVETKLALSATEMVLRGILCNFIVCISVMASIKMKSESAKMTVMFWCIFAFVVAGFEHSIANMGTFSMAYFMGIDIPLMPLLNSMFWVTIGNILGGTVLYSLPLYKMATD